MKPHATPGRSLLLGLDDSTAQGLAPILKRRGYTVDQQALRLSGDYSDLLRSLQPDVVFCAAEGEAYLGLIEQARASMPGLPIIVVGRCAEPRQWLDALDAGAYDFCVPPFESVAIGWVLDKL